MLHRSVRRFVPLTPLSTIVRTGCTGFTGSILSILFILSQPSKSRTGFTGFTGFILSILFILSHAVAEAQIAAAAPAAAPSFAEPAPSPDGQEIAFVSGGDVWTVSASGGEARLLVSHPATESRPLWSPDGTRLAFVSTRTGNGDVYVLTLATGELARVTYDDALDQLDAWSADGRWLYFSSSARDISGMEDVYRVRADSGGTPMLVAADRYANEYWSAPSPDGATLAITARGITDRQWWRNGHSHLDESELWLVRPAADGRAAPAYESLTKGGAKDEWPMWGDAAGRTLYFVSDRGGAQNVWSMPAAGGPATQVTRFTSGRVLWPAISADRRTIVFERDFRVWRLDLAKGDAREVPITLRGAPAAPGVEHVALTSNFRDLALSPDGKKVAFVARGEIFAASAKDGGDATRVTRTAAPESQPVWSPDSRRLVYVSERDGASRLYLYDFATRAERALGWTVAAGASTGVGELPRWSPDGARVAYVRDGRELRVIDVATGADRAVAPVVVDRPPLGDARQYAWSPDGRWLAVLTASGKAFTNVAVVPATGGGEARPVSFTANANANTVSWSPDGTFLLFDSGQRTEVGQLLRVDLVARTPRFREDQFRDLFNEQSPKPSQPGRDSTRSAAAATRADSAARGDSASATRGGRRPVTIDFTDVRRRLAALPLGVDVQWQTISPDGKLALVIADAAGQTNLYTWSLDELAKEDPVARQLTSTPGAKSDAWFSPDGKEVFYLDAGRINVVALDARTPRPLAVSAELDVDFAAEKGAVFDEGWRLMRDNFFDEHFNGVDWNAERRTYGAQVAGARTPDEMRRIMSLMVGDLNASHLGVGAPPSGPAVTGRIGLRFDRLEYERAGRLRVTEVIPLSPAAVGGVKVGDELLAVDGRALGAHTNLDALLERTIGRRVTLSVRGEGGNTARDVAVRPVNLATEKGLLYRAWVESRRAYVSKASNGRLGYVHMIDMSSQSLSQLYADLDAENQSREGVIVDVRNNNGGFVNAYALDVLARRPYLTMTQRGRPTAPARPVLGQRALELPTVLVTNQHSLSDAEDFTEGYRALGLGRVVGEPTAGWIIFTWNTALLDGTTFRLPRARIRAADGSDMELHPRPVDVTVVRPVGESYTGKDSQLDAAVAELLGKVGKAAQH
ncbi:MAG TPA: S41 family peptidase [Gemmatimonadaceae bacterium]|nr:S41 family peptidase [Gemmatimonadaceae bacterium]